jgi:hypothetical protein
MCVGCDNLFVDDEVEYRYKGKSYCNDCYKRIYAVELENKNKTISSKMSKFGKGFKIPTRKVKEVNQWPRRPRARKGQSQEKEPNKEDVEYMHAQNN